MKIEKMGSKQAREALEATEKRLAQVSGRIEEIKPPARPMGATEPTPVGAPVHDPLASAGPEYRALVDAGDDPAALAELVREYEQLRAEQTMLEVRRQKLRTRLKAAEHDEAVERAPKVAGDGLDALTALLDDADAKMRAAADALERVAETRRKIDDARELLDNGAPFYSPAILRRLWALDTGPVKAGFLRKTISTRPDALPVMRQAIGSTAKVVGTEFVRDAEKKLSPPHITPVDPGRFARDGQLAEHRARQEEERQQRQHAAARAQELAQPMAS